VARAQASAADLPERPLLAVAAAGAAGDQPLLRRLLGEARTQGSPAPEALREALLQLVPYAGFPRAIAALGTAHAVFGSPAGPGEPPPPETGPALFERVYGPSAPEVRRALRSAHPALEAWTLRFAYGEALARPDALDLRARELLAVAILTALGDLPDPLLGHMRACLRVGASAEVVAAAVEAVPPSLGEARRAAARSLLARL
jgi:4-carboxymuconolactone decarboxylase